LASNAQEVTISHSTSMEVGTTLVACQPNATSSDNSYYRFFKLDDFSLSTGFNINKVTFGINILNLTDLTTFPIYIKIYSTTSNTFPSTFPTGFNELSTVDAEIEDVSIGELVDITYASPVNIPAGSNLVVVIGYEAQIAGSLNRLFFAGNDLGQTAPTYLSSIACSITTPTNMANIGNGFPNAQLVLSVTGTPGLSTDSFLNSNFSIYPNPVTDILNVKAIENFENLSYELNDLNGRTLYNGTTETINMAGYNAGVYVLNILQDGAQVGSQKIIKK
jgi:hypothetical protein